MIYSRIADRLCERGRFGQKTGGGWYDYRAGDRSAHPSPEVAALVEAHRAGLSVQPRRLDEREIVERLVYALVLEGTALLGEGIAQRASDIDVVYVAGYGFPAWRGGPMFYADEIGRHAVARRIREFGRNPHGDPAFWNPAPLLAQPPRLERAHDAGVRS
jgi:3-hydroxyacyl-CoA dehydrogenase